MEQRENLSSLVLRNNGGVEDTVVDAIEEIYLYAEKHKGEQVSDTLTNILVPCRVAGSLHLRWNAFQPEMFLKRYKTVDNSLKELKRAEANSITAQHACFQTLNSFIHSLCTPTRL